jgi:hypothetical protein
MTDEVIPERDPVVNAADRGCEIDARPPITLAAVLAVVDETHKRNVSEENWHSRVKNALVEKFGKAAEAIGNAIGEAKFGGDS